MADELLNQLIQRAQTDIDRKLLPTPVNAASPSWLRAAELVRRQYPSDMVGVRIKDMDWNKDPNAFTNVVAATPIRGIDKVFEQLRGKTGPPADDPYTIKTNPAYGILHGSEALAPTIAHELEHVRQNRSDARPLDRYLTSVKMGYYKDPDEINAFNKEDEWEKLHPPQTTTGPSIKDHKAIFEQLKNMRLK